MFRTKPQVRAQLPLRNFTSAIHTPRGVPLAELCSTFPSASATMGGMDNEEGWARLGRLLVDRRRELGYPKRAAFARDSGLTHDRVLFDLEHGRRDTYDAGTLGLVESIYRWRRGSIEAVLSGGDPRPIADTGQAARELLMRPEEIESPFELALAMSLARHPAAQLTIQEARGALAATSRALQDAVEEWAYETHRLNEAQAAVARAAARRVSLEEEQGRLKALIEKLEEIEHGDTAPSTRAGVSPAPPEHYDVMDHGDAGRFGLAARPGMPDQERDMTTGEESQDAGIDEPA